MKSNFNSIRISITLLVILITIIQSSTFAQSGYQIKGKINDFDQNSTAYLYTFGKEGRKVLDSTKVVKGSFIFKGTVQHPTQVSIQIKTIRRGFDLFLENESYNVVMAKDWEGKSHSTGGKEMGIQSVYDAEVADLTAKMQELSKQYGELGNEERIELGNKMNELNEEQAKIQYQYIQNHPSSLAILHLIRPRFEVMNFKELEDMVNTFSPELAYSNVYTNLLELYKKKRSEYLVGQQAPDFSIPNISGKSISLSSLKGRYVLVDFWASWCTPCRAANQKIKPIYEKYKNKGFEIVSISMDDKRNLWEEAVKKDGLPWIQVSELTGLKEGSISAQYYVKSLPTVFLLDKTGKVIAQNLSEKELEEILEKQLTN